MSDTASISTSQRIEDIKKKIKTGRELLTEMDIFYNMFNDIDHVLWAMKECNKGIITEEKLSELSSAAGLLRFWLGLNKYRVGFIRQRASDYVQNEENHLVAEVEKLLEQSEEKNKGQVPKFISKGRLAKKLGVSYYKINKWTRDGLLPTPRMFGKRQYWHIAEVDDIDLSKIRASR